MTRHGEKPDARRRRYERHKIRMQEDPEYAEDFIAKRNAASKKAREKKREQEKQKPKQPGTPAPIRKPGRIFFLSHWRGW